MSAIEILSPIFLCAVLVYIRGQVAHEVFPSVEITEVTYDEEGDVGYSAVYHYPLIEETRFPLRSEEIWMEESV